MALKLAKITVTVLPTNETDLDAACDEYDEQDFRGKLEDYARALIANSKSMKDCKVLVEE